MTTPSGAASAKCVGELRLAPVVTVSAGISLAAAARVMIRTGTAFVAIEGSDRVLSREDVVRAVANDQGDEELADVLSHARSTLLVVGRRTPAMAVLGELVRSGGPGVIVVDADRVPCGVLRLRDLVEATLDDLALLTGLRHVLHVEGHL